MLKLPTSQALTLFTYLALSPFSALGSQYHCQSEARSQRRAILEFDTEKKKGSIRYVYRPIASDQMYQGEVDLKWVYSDFKMTIYYGQTRDGVEAEVKFPTFSIDFARVTVRLPVSVSPATPSGVLTPKWFLDCHKVIE